MKIISIPPTYFLFGIIFSLVLYFVFPEMNLIKFPINLIGIFFLVLGFYLISKSYYLFKEYNTPENFNKSTHLVQTNLYKYSRNPMYLGAVVFFVGLSFILGNVISFVVPIFFFIIINFMFIPYEEDKMVNTFGDEYLSYKKKVKCWF
ncbi:isoprenylcysteine carboxylmethyltransferase family protein [archaeon]|nr:isoprenylcysteine carboxylmethyltransferase family protein [archaeon]